MPMNRRRVGETASSDWGRAEIRVSLDGKEVWKEARTPGIVGQPVDPYWLADHAADSHRLQVRLKTELETQTPRL